MAKTRFVFGVDLDGVCADFYGGMRKVAAEWLGVPIEKLTTNVSYGLPEWRLGRVGDYEDLHRFAVTQRDLFRTLEPVPGAPQTLRRLSRKGIWIRIVTHRLFIKYFHQEAVRQTIEWLDNHDIPYWDLCFTKEKAAVGADLYIEDSPDNIRKLRADGHKVIIFTNSTNRRLPGQRANSWKEVERLVLAELKKWRKKKRSKRKLYGE